MRSTHSAMNQRRFAGIPAGMVSRPARPLRPAVVSPGVVVRASLDQQDSDMKAAEARWDAQVRRVEITNQFSRIPHPLSVRSTSMYEPCIEGSNVLHREDLVGFGLLVHLCLFIFFLAADLTTIPQCE